MMKIAFLYGENAFTVELLRQLRIKLAGHEVLAWISGKTAPAHDLDLLLVHLDPTKCRVERAQLANQPKLALIHTVISGYENIDINAASDLGIWVSYAPSNLTGNAASVAEFALLLLLGASRHLGEVLLSQRDDSVKPSLFYPALSGKTVCIVGLGNIGRLLVDRLRPFGVRMVATDEHPENAPAGVTAYPANRLSAAVAEADYVVVCVRASKENENLIDAAMMRAMKRGAILVNIARGSLVDEEALIAAVKDGQISAAGLDVLKNEPLDAKNPLLQLPQILVTPHIAGPTDLNLSGTADYSGLVVEQFLAGKKPISILNSPRSPRRALA
jgi:phosphoglycerate dehydrogenase-like enzyme